MERDVESTRRALGVGRGWRLNNRRNRYRVVEPPPVDFDALLEESEAVAARLGCTCVREVVHA